MKKGFILLIFIAISSIALFYFISSCTNATASSNVGGTTTSSTSSTATLPAGCTVTPANGSDISQLGSKATIIVKYDTSMDSTSLSITGDLKNDGANTVISTADNTNDTITITPSTQWTIKQGATLNIQYTVLAGSIKTANLTFNVIDKNILATFNNNTTDDNLWGGSNNVYGDPGAITASISNGAGIGGTNALKLSYSNIVGYFGYYQMNLLPSGNKNLSAYNYISFYVKADTAAFLRVALRDGAGTEVKIPIADFINGPITSTYQEVRIHFDYFKKCDLTNILWVGFFFEAYYIVTLNSYSASNSIYIDNISFGSDSDNSVIIDNFSDKSKLNAFGNDNSYWNNPPATITASISTTYYDAPSSLSLTYNTNGTYLGTSYPFNGPLDLNACKYLIFYLRGDNTTDLEIQLNDSSSHQLLLSQSDQGNTPIPSASWQKYSYAISAFGTNMAAIQQLNINIADGTCGSNKAGRIWIDKIMFTKDNTTDY